MPSVEKLGDFGRAEVQPLANLVLAVFEDWRLVSAMIRSIATRVTTTPETEGYLLGEVT